MGKESPELLSVSKPQKRSLLERYDIPVEHLSYEYISECTDSKILERIILILRSGEEGVYPDLTRHAEKRLAVIKPGSIVLRKAEPILKRCMLNASERNEIENDISHWMSLMQCREKDLEEGKTALLSEPYPQPAIREIKERPRTSNKTSRTKRISSCDYAAWDKFDADTEINKIDIQEEQRCVEIKNKQQREKTLAEKSQTKDVMINKSSLTGTEISIMAEQEKEKGNEAFRAGDYNEALAHYNLSIKIDANLTAYNNRAMTYIKLQRYEDAFNDCNTVLSMEHSNIKALLRRALSLEHTKKNSQALVDYESVLRLEPTNTVAIAGVKKLKKPCQSRKVRMVIEEKCLNGDEEVVNDESESQQCAGNNSISLELRETENLGGSICFCDRAPGPSQIVKPRPHFRAEYCLDNRGMTKKSKSEVSLANETADSKRLTASKSSFNLSNTLGKSVKTKSIFSCNASNNKSSVIIEELPAESCKSVSTDGKNVKEENMRNTREKNAAGDGRSECNIENSNNEDRNVDTNSKNRLGSSLKKIQVQDNRENNSNKVENDNRECIVNSPYEFTRMWHSLKNDTDYKSHADLLRSLNRDKLTTVFGSELDGTMFNTIVHCLERHFCTTEDTELLISLLKSLSSASRFSIVNMFMNADDKKALERVFGYLENQDVPDIRDLRGLYRI